MVLRVAIVGQVSVIAGGELDLFALKLSWAYPNLTAAAFLRYMRRKVQRGV